MFSCWSLVGALCNQHCVVPRVCLGWSPHGQKRLVLFLRASMQWWQPSSAQMQRCFVCAMLLILSSGHMDMHARMTLCMHQQQLQGAVGVAHGHPSSSPCSRLRRISLLVLEVWRRQLGAAGATSPLGNRACLVGPCIPMQRQQPPSIPFGPAFLCVGDCCYSAVGDGRQAAACRLHA